MKISELKADNTEIEMKLTARSAAELEGLRDDIQKDRRFTVTAPYQGMFEADMTIKVPLYNKQFPPRKGENVDELYGDSFAHAMQKLDMVFGFGRSRPENPMIEIRAGVSESHFDQQRGEVTISTSDSPSLQMPPHLRKAWVGLYTDRLRQHPAVVLDEVKTADDGSVTFTVTDPFPVNSQRVIQKAREVARDLAGELSIADMSAGGRRY